MNISIRDCHLPPVFGGIAIGLSELKIDSVEIEFHRDMRIHSLDTAAIVNLSNREEIEIQQDKLGRLGLNVSALLLHNNFGKPDVDAEIEWVITAIKTANMLGAKAVRVDAVMCTQDEWPLDKCIAHFAECMHRVLDATKNIDIALGIENHGKVGNDPDFLETVVAKIDSPNVGVTLDTANFYWRGHPLSKVHDIIERLSPKVKHTHIKNIAYPESEREIEREIGWKYDEYASSLREGDINIPWVVEKLKAAGYSGDLCIENESLGRYDIAKQKEILKDDVDYIKEILGK